MDNSINFKGVFLIKRPSSLRDAILPALKNEASIKQNKLKGIQIFNNLNQSGDTLFVVRDKYDRSIANLILSTPNAKFKYYPSLNTKSGFDIDDAKGAKLILSKVKDNVIQTKEKLLASIKKPVDVIKTNIKRIQEKNLKLMQKETFLDLQDKKYKKNIDINTGICTVTTLIRDSKTGKNKKHTLIKITPPGLYGKCYATYTPVSETEPTRRIAVQNGKKIFEYVKSDSAAYIDAISDKKYIPDQFRDNENAAIVYYAEKLKKQKQTFGV